MVACCRDPAIANWHDECGRFKVLRACRLYAPAIFLPGGRLAAPLGNFAVVYGAHAGNTVNGQLHRIIYSLLRRGLGPTSQR